MARIGLIAKGMVYALIGTLVLLSLTHVRSEDPKQANKGGVFQFVQELPAGQLLLFIIIAGLICYTVWRLIQSFKNSTGEEIKFSRRIRYFFSGLTYGSLAFYGFKFLSHQKSADSGSGNEKAAQQVLEFSAGEWLLGAASLVMAGIGVYQFYYALSEKYKKHVSTLNLPSTASKALLGSGKVGYLARGFVWFIVAFLLFKAALHSNSKEAGSTGDAFEFLQDASYGNYLLAALALGLVAYGVFNFVRARYESFH